MPDATIRSEEPRTVLLIEDDEDTSVVFSAALRYLGYRVFEASDGVDGIQAARDLRPDVILMDLGLPRLDGWEVIRLLKHDSLTAAIPIVAVTVHVQDFYRARADAAGCDRFVAKPCLATDLDREISLVLQ